MMSVVRWLRDGNHVVFSPLISGSIAVVLVCSAVDYSLVVLFERLMLLARINQMILMVIQLLLICGLNRSNTSL